MSIFVDKNEEIKVKVEYIDENNKITIIDSENDGKVLSTNPPLSINLVFKRPDFALSQRIISASTVNEFGGSPTIDVLLLQTNMMYFLLKSWDVKDQDGKVIEASAEAVGLLRVEIARAIVNKMIDAVGQIL